MAQTTQKLQTNHAGVVHPNFDPNQTPVNPDRPLTDVPNPVPRLQETLRHLLDREVEAHDTLTIGYLDAQDIDKRSLHTFDTTALVSPNFAQASMWELIASPELASHLELLQVGGLINLPKQFFKDAKVNIPAVVTNKSEPLDAKQCKVNHKSSSTDSQTTEQDSIQNSDDDLHDTQPVNSNELLRPLTKMRLLDLSDIHDVCLQYPALSRYGLDAGGSSKISYDERTNQETNSVLPNMPEMINDVFAPSWEVILYPERFDNHVDSLSTDILACSVAVHILKQCQRRKSINRSISAQQVCHHMRSYVLSQCNIHPQYEKQYRQIRLFVGHVAVAAAYLGFDIQVSTHDTPRVSNNASGQGNDQLSSVQHSESPEPSIYLNVSSRSSLFTRYPNLNNYYINGWS